MNRSSKASRYGTLQYRARRVGNRRWRGILWRDTQAKQHYRSVNVATHGVVVGGSTSTDLNVDKAVQDNFWLAAGGAKSIDDSLAASDALFKGDITIRGGQIAYKYHNGTGSPLSLKLWLVFTVRQIDDDFTLPPTFGWGDDLTIIPEFRRQFGKVVKGWDVKLEDGETWSVKWRLRPQKVDQGTWNTADGRGSQFNWIYAVYSDDGSSPSTSDSHVLVNHNLSFSGDVYDEQE